jgi:hypothetical protein
MPPWATLRLTRLQFALLFVIVLLASISLGRAIEIGLAEFTHPMQEIGACDD